MFVKRAELQEAACWPGDGNVFKIKETHLSSGVSQITKLKIDSNPFAKGFRDSSRLTDMERYRGFWVLRRVFTHDKIQECVCVCETAALQKIPCLYVFPSFLNSHFLFYILPFFLPLSFVLFLSFIISVPAFLSSLFPGLSFLPPSVVDSVSLILPFFIYSFVLCIFLVLLSVLFLSRFILAFFDIFFICPLFRSSTFSFLHFFVFFPHLHPILLNHI